MSNFRFANYSAISALSFLFLFLSGCQKEVFTEPAPNQSGVSKQVNRTSSVPEPCIQRCLVAGQNTNIGTVDISLSDNGDIFITYNITKPNIYLLEVHSDIFSSLQKFKQDKKLNSGGAIPGKFAFANSWQAKAKITSYTVTVPKAYVDQYGSAGCLFIATHAALSNGETAWGGLCADTPKETSLENARQFPGSNWSVYFDFCADQCKAMDFTFGWEDLNGAGNDADYNDLVIQANSVRFGNQLKLGFQVVARGAFNDHMFKVRIPKQGIISINSLNPDTPITYESNGSDYIITIFTSTKVALSPNGAAYFQSNTYKEFDCVPFTLKEIVLTVDNSFVYNTSTPYYPFISVYPSGAAGAGPSYDLSIFEFTGQSTWTSPTGAVYPNGIIIPNNWKWPLEGQIITGPYPSFPSYNWASNLVDPSLTYDINKCY
ncbi:MAG: DUF4842 domain-containing protein [Sphingobacteriaceae bacterium]|nr:DUF4842 domain-containing protein [Sphingobacteriaceae bacterium]